MILQQILEVFDGELDRLQKLREVVRGLERPSVLPPVPELLATLTPPEPTKRGRRKRTESAAEESGTKKVRGERAHTQPAEADGNKRPDVSRKGQQGSRRRSQAAEEASALRGTIPKGPVVVSAAQVRAAVKTVSTEAHTVRSTPEPGSLGSMIRALRLDGDGSRSAAGK